MNAPKLLSRLLVPAICLAAIVGGASVALACPSCQSALAEGQGDLARGLYYSILFMMSMPFAIVGTFAGLMYRAVKREQRRKAAEAAQKDSATESRGQG